MGIAEKWRGGTEAAVPKLSRRLVPSDSIKDRLATFRQNPPELLDGANGRAFTKMMWAVLLPPLCAARVLGPCRLPVTYRGSFTVMMPTYL